jgi:hypothetical protein
MGFFLLLSLMYQIAAERPAGARFAARVERRPPVELREASPSR